MARSTPGWFACQYEHVFQWGNEDWHKGASQRWSLKDKDFAPFGAPAYCPCEWDDGEPCMDSSILIGPYASPEEAIEKVREYKERWDWQGYRWGWTHHA